MTSHEAMSWNSLGADASASALINWRLDSMQNVILRRVAGAVFTMWIILTILFFLFRLGLPDPTVALVSDGLSPDDRAIVMQRFGLDRPLHEQYFIYLRNAVTGELGRSFHYNAPVAGLIGERFLNTIVLMIPALIRGFAAEDIDHITIGKRPALSEFDVQPQEDVATLSERS